MTGVDLYLRALLEFPGKHLLCLLVIATLGPTKGIYGVSIFPAYLFLLDHADVVTQEKTVRVAAEGLETWLNAQEH